MSAALSHDLGIAIGNILGGIAIQTVVLVALDAFGAAARSRRSPIARRPRARPRGAASSSRCSSSSSGHAAPAGLIAWPLDAGVAADRALWLAGLLLLQRAATRPAVARGRRRARTARRSRCGTRRRSERGRRAAASSTTRTAIVFARRRARHARRRRRARAERRAIAGHIGMTGVLFGATVPGRGDGPARDLDRPDRRCGRATTSSPSATSSAATRSCRCCSWSRACSRAPRCSRRRSDTDIYLTALGALLTVVYVVRACLPPAPHGRRAWASTRHRCSRSTPSASPASSRSRRLDVRRRRPAQVPESCGACGCALCRSRSATPVATGGATIRCASCASHLGGRATLFARRARSCGGTSRSGSTGAANPKPKPLSRQAEL